MSTRIILTMPEQLVRDLDEQAKKRHQTRSELIRSELVRCLEQRSAEEETRRQRGLALKEMERIRAKTSAADFDSTKFIRRQRHKDA